MAHARSFEPTHRNNFCKQANAYCQDTGEPTATVASPDDQQQRCKCLIQMSLAGGTDSDLNG